MSVKSSSADAPIVIDDDNDQNQSTQDDMNNVLMGMIVDTCKHDFSDHQQIWKEKVNSLDVPTAKKILEPIMNHFKDDFDSEVSVAVLKTLLSNWPGFETSPTSTSKFHRTKYRDVFYMISRNFGPLRNFVYCKLSKTNILDINENLNIDCPLKKLKTLFNSRFHMDEGNIYDLRCKDSIKVEYNYSPQNFTNWPYIGVKFSIDGFEIIHENYNHYEFNVLNIDNQMNKPVLEQPMNTELHFSPETVGDEFATSQRINQYLFNLRTRIMRKTCTLPPAKKVELITYLNEFTYDVRLADGNIGIGVAYYANFSSYPYVRFMANTNHCNYPRGRVSGNEITIRLQQITYPAVKFSILKFDMMEDLDALLQKNLMDSLTYYCTLCDKPFRTSVFNEITKHVMEAHGPESGYVCVKCDKSFAVKILSGNRWSHVCLSKS